jgi:hypothetical protein
LPRSASRTGGRLRDGGNAHQVVAGERADSHGGERHGRQRDSDRQRGAKSGRGGQQVRHMHPPAEESAELKPDV